MYTYGAHAVLTYSFDFGAARLDPCELRTVIPYTYTLSERSAELHARQLKSPLTYVLPHSGELEKTSKYYRSRKLTVACDGLMELVRRWFRSN
ncbi:hypothetical protein EVAR_96244_1 [Eumeta japonica]|uniref:Uncharacterized protein n=1 Tax=Eumeta variegata TaxID=151549 RepID=A0A4C1WJQ3_EUMVA|nr:hypothetical protein EVAR_96244_1 [Eumeta japonica]